MALMSGTEMSSPVYNEIPAMGGTLEAKVDRYFHLGEVYCSRGNRCQTLEMAKKIRDAVCVKCYFGFVTVKEYKGSRLHALMEQMCVRGAPFTNEDIDSCIGMIACRLWQGRACHTHLTYLMSKPL